MGIVLQASSHPIAQQMSSGTAIAVITIVRRLVSTVLALSLLVGTAHAEAQQQVSLRGCDGHGRPVDLEALRGQVVAVTFASRYTSREADKINAALLRHADAGDMVVITVVDFAGVPSLFYGYARRKAAEHDQPGRIIHLMDEHGELRRRFQVEPKKRVDIFIIDRQGFLRGRFTGERQLEEAVRLVDVLRTSSALR